MEGREKLDDDLENQEFFIEEGVPYFIEEVWRGQTRGKQSIFSEKVQDTHVMSGVIKFDVKIKDKEPEEDKPIQVKDIELANKKTKVVKRKEIDEDFKPFIIQKLCTVRLYVLEGKNLTPRDRNDKSDPYLIVKLGDKVIEDKSSMRP